jgi:hypothetical protein
VSAALKLLTGPLIAYLLLLLPAFAAALLAADYRGVLLPRAAAAFGVTLLAAGTAVLLRRHPRGCRIAASTLLSLYFLLELFELSSFFLTGKSFDIEYYYHFNWKTFRYGLAGFHRHLIFAAFCLAATVAAFVRLAWRPPRVRRHAVATGLALLGVGALPLIFAASPLSKALGLVARMRSADAAAALDPDAMIRFGIKPTLLGRDEVAATPGKNLIFIYLESIEDTYLYQRDFPGLLPNLYRFVTAESLWFANLRQARNANFSFGGMFASMTGSILTDAHLRGDQNDGYNLTLGNDLVGFPGILRRAGYHQVFMIGHHPQFAGTNVLLEQEEYDEVLSAAELIDGQDTEAKRRQADAWGVHDDALFDAAFAKFIELSKSGKPFNLSLFTIDSHHPDGFTAPGGPVYAGRADRRVNLLNALHATDLALGRFIDRLKASPYWRDTVVVLLTDHLAMKNTVSDLLEANPDRKLLFCALNAGEPRAVPDAGKTFDVAPTVLAMLGVEHNFTFPLGENLLDRPDPRRLSGDAPEAEKILTGYLWFKSRTALPPRFEVRVIAAPHPALQIDRLRIPLFGRHWGLQYLPGRGESFAVRIDRANRIAEYRRFEAPAALDEFIQAHPDSSFVVLASGSGTSFGDVPAGHYGLFYLKDGRCASHRSADPGVLHLASDELR